MTRSSAPANGPDWETGGSTSQPHEAGRCFGRKLRLSRAGGPAKIFTLPGALAAEKRHRQKF